MLLAEIIVLGHHHCLPAALLEQEQWGNIEVHPQFQAIVDELEQRAADLAAAEASPAPAASVAARPNGRLAAADADEVGAAVGTGHPVRAVDAQAAEDARAANPRKFTITPQQQEEGGGGDGAASTSDDAVVVGGGGSPAAVLRVGGHACFHVVNTQLLLLSMLREYLAFRDAVPAFSAEVAQRVLELLKVFNSRTCQLVLGAGAMQVGHRPPLQADAGCAAETSGINALLLPAQTNVSPLCCRCLA